MNEGVKFVPDHDPTALRVFARRTEAGGDIDCALVLRASADEIERLRELVSGRVRGE